MPIVGLQQLTSADVARLKELLRVFIFVQADLRDDPAIALYESLGTKETAHHFDIKVAVAGAGHNQAGRSL
jgi:hypothetical protein